MALDCWSEVASGDTNLGSVHEVAGRNSSVTGIEDDVEVNADDSQAKGSVGDTAVGGLGSVKESDFVLAMASGPGYAWAGYAGAARSAIWPTERSLYLVLQFPRVGWRTYHAGAWVELACSVLGAVVQLELGLRQSPRVMGRGHLIGY